ncbi:integrase core domain-containing protein [Xanthomonas vasicola]|uniref:integrase core domain-containing protein n=1 Tax=Xanthomonas vasicola TaxID=56459 RepID=UPI0030B8EBD3
MILLVLKHHPHRLLTNLWRILHCFAHDSILSRVGACGNPGAAQIRSLKEQCVHRHRFESQTHALRVIADWTAFYNQQRPHQALKMMTPNAAYAATLTA